MAERKKSKGSKWNEGEEGTDGSKEKGGGGGKDHEHKRSKIGGAAHFVHKRVTGQPKVTQEKKEGKSDLSSFDTPTLPPSLAQESSQQQPGSRWSLTPRQPLQDTKQQAPTAVISSVPSGETLPSTEGATPPTAHDTSVSDSQSVSTIKDFGAPNEFSCSQAMSGSGPMNNQKVVKSDAHVDQGASGTQLDPPISKSERECKQDSLIIQGSKEENETKENDYELRISQLTKLLSKKEEEVIKLKIDQNANKALLKERLKEKDKAYNEQEAIKLQLEKELAAAREEVTLLNEKLNYTSKEKISELEKEMNKKYEHLQLKEVRIKHLEEQLLEKEEYMFIVEGSNTADKRDKELMIKQVEVAEATRRIDELEETHKEQLKEIYRLREKNTVLKGTVEEQGNMREKLTELEALFDKVAASHEEEMNHIRRKEEAKRVELEEKWKKKIDEEFQQKTQSHVQELNETVEAIKKKYKDRADRLQAREKELQAQLDKFSQENKELKEHLYNREEAYSVLQDSLDRKSVTSMELEKQLQDIMKHSAEKDQKIEEISERLALKETENELFKQDFESERNDRVKINDQLIKLQAQHALLKQESAEKEKEAQMKFHNLKQSNSTLVRELEKSTKGAEIESLVQKIAQLEKQHTEEMKKNKKKLKDLETGETDRVKEMEEEIQVLTAQVNAYSHEVDKQKGLVTQSQGKHKTEIIELNERLSNELKSKKQLDNELDRMKQQLVNVSANKEELLRAYNKEQKMVSDLEDKIRNMQQASRTLRDRMSESQKQLLSKQKEITSLQEMFSGFRNSWKLSSKEIFLSKELGRGGYGVVWVGQLRVAVKKLHEWIVSQHNMETFHHEINIMSQLRHPNLLQFIGAILDHPSGCPMIVTEVMDTSLREAYETKKLTPDPGCRPVILSIMHDAAEGLNYLHCLLDPIIHRDVSSANVLLQSVGYRRWKGKISDFGSAKLAKKAITEGPGAFVYSAPEAFQSIASHDPTKKQTTKMDVFSYGVLLCEIITCHFPDDMDIFRDMLCQVLSISNRPSGTRDTQGSLLHSLIVLCCHDDPSRRPTMKEIIEQLDIISK